MSAIGRTEQAGFTLVEMLVVLAVTALVAGLSFPALERVQAGQQLRQSASRLEAELLQTRARAIALDETLRFAASASLPRDGVTGLPPKGLFFYRDGSSNGAMLSVSMAAGQMRLAVDPATGAVGRPD